VRLLPSEVSRIRYEDLRAILLDYYREHKPRSIIKRCTGDTDSAGNKLTGGSLCGCRPAGQLLQTDTDHRIYGHEDQGVIQRQRKAGASDATIRRQIGNLRSAFTQAKALDLITDNYIPTSVLPPTPNLGEDSSIFQTSIPFARPCRRSASHVDVLVFQQLPLGNCKENYLGDG
jgi:hypothetical protein